MSNTYAVVQKVDFSSYRRVIAISDIHGDIDGFNGVLEKMGFSQEDALVVVGDILEKGEHSLALLQRVKSLSENGNVFMVIGNNDTAFRNLYSDFFSDKDICWYMNSSKKTILVEMADALGMPYSTEGEVALLKKAIRQHYDAEYRWLESVPHIIDSKQAIFVHAGLESEDLYHQNPQYCMAAPAFSGQTHRFERLVVVGHWPATNYCETIIDANAFYKEETNVYSIDGGNSMKSWEQINYLIFHNDGSIEKGYYDALPKIRLLQDQEASNNPLTLVFPNTLLEVRRQLGDSSLCFVPHLDREMEVPNNRMYRYGGKTYRWDYTDYHLQVNAGKVVSFCGEMDGEVLIKRDGIVGKYSGEYVFV